VRLLPSGKVDPASAGTREALSVSIFEALARRNLKSLRQHLRAVEACVARRDPPPSSAVTSGSSATSRSRAILVPSPCGAVRRQTTMLYE